MIKYSVLISVYAREKGEYLTQALESIFNQTIQPDEVVLVEDGALTDELYCVIDKFKKQHKTLKVLKLAQNVGLGEALNRGLSVCSYDLVARMDSDDVCLKNRFEEQLKIFSSNNDISVVGSWIDEFSTDTTRTEGSRKLPEYHNDIIKFARSKSPINHPTVMFKKDAIEAVGSYKPFYLLEDYYLWARLLNNGYKFYNIQQSLVLMRTGDGMFARRGGWKYIKSEINLQYEFFKMGFIDYLTLIKNIIIRFTVRMMPNRLRTFVYKNLLRN